MPAGAFYAFADVRAFGMETQILCERILEEARVVCTPGSCFGSCGEGFIRFHFGQYQKPSAAQIRGRRDQDLLFDRDRQGVRRDYLPADGGASRNRAGRRPIR